MATVEFKMNLPAVFSQEDGVVVGCFPNLDVVSQGRTRDEAERNLIEAAQLFIESCFQRNVLDEVLKACGFTPDHAEASTGPDHLIVPFQLLSASDGPASRAC